MIPALARPGRSPAAFRLTGLLALIAFALLAGCAARSAPGAVAGSLPGPDLTYSAPLEDYRARGADRIEVRVTKLETLNGTYELNAEGAVILPLLGRLDLAGMTAFEITGLLREQLGARYLQNPDVIVTLTPGFDQKLTVEGAVERPGQYDARPGLSLLQAIAIAGGPKAHANKKRVVIVRQSGGERHAGIYDLEAIRNSESEDPAVYGNDLIIVDGSEARAAYNDLIRSAPLMAVLLGIF